MYIGDQNVQLAANLILALFNYAAGSGGANIQPYVKQAQIFLTGRLGIVHDLGRLYSIYIMYIYLYL